MTIDEPFLLQPKSFLRRDIYTNVISPSLLWCRSRLLEFESDLLLSIAYVYSGRTSEAVREHASHIWEYLGVTQFSVLVIKASRQMGFITTMTATYATVQEYTMVMTPDILWENLNLAAFGRTAHVRFGWMINQPYNPYLVLYGILQAVYNFMRSTGGMYCLHRRTKVQRPPITSSMKSCCGNVAR